MDVISISDLRTNLPALIKETSENLKRFIVTVSGKPKAVVISPEELESLEETAEILAVPGALEGIRQGSKEIKQGKGIPLEEIEKKYNL